MSINGITKEKISCLESIATGDNPASRSSRMWADSLRYAPSSLVPAVTAAAASAVFTRLLTPSQYGIYGLALAISGPVATVLGQLVGNGTGRYYIDYVKAGKLDAYRQAVTGLIYVEWAVCFVLTGIAVGITVMFDHSQTLCWLVLGTGALVAIQSATTVLIPILSASFRPLYYSLAVSAGALLSFGSSFALIWAVSDRSYWLVWGSALGQACVLPLIMHRFPLSPLRHVIHLSREARTAMGEFLRYGAPMVLWVLFSSIMGVTDRTILQVVDGSAAVGVYGINNSMAVQGMGIVTGPMITASWPILMRHWADSGRKAVEDALALFTRTYILIGVGIVGAAAVVGDPFEHVLLGARFTGGVDLLVPTLVAWVFWGGGRLGHATLKLGLRTRTLAMDALFCGMFNVALNILVIPRYGMLGAAYALIPSFLLYSLLVWYQSRATAHWRVDLIELVGLVAVAISGWFLAAHLIRWLAGDNILQVLIGGISFGLIYMAGSWVLWRRPGTLGKQMHQEKEIESHG